ncbi:hypothetical protein ACHQM5_001389 [Ranunculus cassubicifolius]
MESTKQLIDSLTSHISLYNSSSQNHHHTNPRRNSIIQWFKSLSISQRQSYLTIVNLKFIEIINQMQSKLNKNGHGVFILLPDLPSNDLPSLCFRKSKGGLLSRVTDSNESERFVHNSVRLFGSENEERIDCLIVTEEFVEDIEKFVKVMDDVSCDGFLRGEESVSGSDWEELEWLKAKGYYNVEAFIVNRIELALRMSWLNCNGGKKKKGGKLREKVNVAGIAANVFWRKKGCVDWWEALDPETKKKVFRTVFGKAAKSLTREIVKEENRFPEIDEWLISTGKNQPLIYDSLSGQSWIRGVSVADAGFLHASLPASNSRLPISLSKTLTSLFVLQKICTLTLSFQHSEHEKDKLFFGTMNSIHTISDYIMRRFRSCLMFVSSECIKHELLAGENVKFPLNKCNDKLTVSSRKGKGKKRNLKKPKSAAKLSGPTGETKESPEKDHIKVPVDGKVQNTGKKSRRKGVTSNILSVVESSTPGSSKFGSMQTACQSHPVQSVARKDDQQTDLTTGNDRLTDVKDDAVVDSSSQEDPVVSLAGGSHHLACCNISSEAKDSSHTLDSEVRESELPAPELGKNVTCKTELKNIKIGQLTDVSSGGVVSPPMVKSVYSNEDINPSRKHEVGSSHAHWSRSSVGSASYEWPSVARFNMPFVNSQHLPAATDRLHLDVGRNWRSHLHQPFVSTRHQPISPSIEGGRNRLLPRTLPVSVDWPPVVRSASRLTPSMNGNYDSGFFPRLQSAYRQGLRPHKLQLNGSLSDDERKYSGEAMDSCEFINTADVADGETHWVSEEEFEVHAFSGRDYSQYFGGGVMYWNTTDLGGSGCSRPPSLSSEDSSWAWHEADLNRAIDDMVGIPSAYSSNGIASPPSGSFCSPFDTLGPAHQALSYVMPGTDVTGKVNHPSSSQADGVSDENVSASFTDSSSSVADRQNGDVLAYPILRPIIIPNLSRKGSRSEFKVSHDRKSPCVPISRRDQPRMKRPPSPIVLCVPRAPCPSPFSPVLETRRRRGFPTVRSGSSSPRHWGMRTWYHDGNNPEEAGVYVDGAEVVWPSWRSKGLSATPMIQPVPGTLLQDRLIAISQLALDQEHPDAAFHLQPQEVLNCPSRKVSLSLMHSLLHDDIDFFCKQVAAKNVVMKPCINWAVKRVARSLQVLWPRSRTNIFGSNATGLSLPTSDVDLVVCLPPVRNLEPIKEAGILEGRNGIKETCLQHAARYLANQEWVKSDSLKTVENTAIPIIMLVVDVPQDVIYTAHNSNDQTPDMKSAQANGDESSSDHSDSVVIEDCSWKTSSGMKKEEGVGVESVRLDISFKSPSHTGLQTTELVRELTEQFPAVIPLALVLKQFLADRSLDHSYSGGLSSYCLVLLITRFLQHEHHLGRSINQNLGSLLMDFLYFFGNVFDPRQMRISIQGSGVYANRDRGHSIDPIHIDDPLFPTNNVGKNCFRIHQCIKAFADAYSTLESELAGISCTGDPCLKPAYRLLQKIIPSIDHIQ